MKISGRTIAYLIILLVVFIAGGITFAGAQGFPPNPLPMPVEESGIVEVVGESVNDFRRGEDLCPGTSFEIYQVPDGKRLIIEHVSAAAWSQTPRRALKGEYARLRISTFKDDRPAGEFKRTGQHLIALSDNFPIMGGGPITMYADAGEEVTISVWCPKGVGVDDIIMVSYAITGRLVPHPHPSMIPTATPAP
jgi:hypothetical protein